MAATSAKAPDTPAAAAVLEEAVDAIQACDKTARKSAKSWLACIEELRNAGATELADREYLALKETYPAKTAELEANK